MKKIKGKYKMNAKKGEKMDRKKEQVLQKDKGKYDYSKNFEQMKIIYES